MEERPQDSPIYIGHTLTDGRTLLHAVTHRILMQSHVNIIGACLSIIEEYELDPGEEMDRLLKYVYDNIDDILKHWVDSGKMDPRNIPTEV